MTEMIHELICQFVMAGLCQTSHVHVVHDHGPCRYVLMDPQSGVVMCRDVQTGESFLLPRDFRVLVEPMRADVFVDRRNSRVAIHGGTWVTQ